MAASKVCWRCLRALQSSKTSPVAKQQSYAQFSSHRILYRPFSSSETRWQQEQQQRTSSSNLRAPNQPQSSNIPMRSTESIEAATRHTTSTSTLDPLPNPSTEQPSLSDGPSVSQMQKQISETLSKPRSDLTANLARRLRRTARSTTETYITYGLTEAYYKSCSSQAGYTIPESQRQNILTGKGPPKTTNPGNASTDGKDKKENEGEDLGIPDISPAGTTWWFDTLGLQPTFSTWSQVTYLHMYLLTVRLRGGLDSASTLQNYHRYLLEHFSHGAEDRMAILHMMGARSVRNRYLKDLFLQWRGLLAAYDEGLVQGDAVLAGAVWRNMWKGREDVDWEKVALVVAYMRKAISLLGELEVEEIVSRLDGPQGVWSRSQRDLDTLVHKPSAGVAEPLTD